MNTSLNLAIRLPNWLGDVIMTLPALEALTNQGYTLELFGKPWIKDLFAAYDYKTHAIPKYIHQARRLYQQKNIKQCLLFTNSLSSALHLSCTGIQGIGYKANCRSFLLSRSLRKKSNQHEVDYFWQLANFATNYQLVNPKQPQLIITDDYIKQAENILQQHNIADEFTVICPGAIGFGEQKSSKIWPHWQELTNHLLKQNKQIIACPAPFEEIIFNKIFPQQVKILTGINIPLYAAIMKKASQVIANDSGPMHLAAAVQTPVLGVFGATNPLRTRPIGGDFIGHLGQWPTLEEVLQHLLTLSIKKNLAEKA
jgi:heptosyltransferase II